VKAALVISDRDNVATALEALEVGRRLDLAGVSVVIAEAIPPGHKVALRDIACGEAVMKYGSAIGLASADIPAGVHVHTHNLSSSRGRGDLGAPLSTTQPRLAEPPDDPVVRAPGVGVAGTVESVESTKGNVGP
jgi:altronate dehydratase small subunit